MTTSLVKIGGGLLALIILCCTVLVGLDKITGSEYLAAVVAPVVAGLIGAIAGIKGVQVGSEASVSPPPEA